MVALASDASAAAGLTYSSRTPCRAFPAGPPRPMIERGDMLSNPAYSYRTVLAARVLDYEYEHEHEHEHE